MPLIEYAAPGPVDGASAGFNAGLKGIIMGLHWDPGTGANSVDLDALCVLFDANGRMLEVIHPKHLRNAGESVVHTGDSLNGASVWDDERIFVFLDVLPENVHALAFVVVSANEQSLHLAPGAYCHISDQSTELQILRVDFRALAACQAHAVAALQRAAVGWTLIADSASLVGDALLVELCELMTRAKDWKEESRQLVG